MKDRADGGHARIVEGFSEVKGESGVSSVSVFALAMFR
jgi:hypothetical protein